MGTSSRRTLVVSRRLVDPQVFNASAYEFEDVIAGIDGCDLVAPAPQPSGLQRAAAPVLSQLRRFGVQYALDSRLAPMSVKGEYEIGFVRAMVAQQTNALDAVREARRHCRYLVCWIEELWSDWLRYDKHLRILDRFDHVFVAHAASVEGLAKKIGRPCTYLPPAVDALRFCPYPNGAERFITVYGMGRRGPDTHGVLLDRTRQDPRFLYLYDSARLTDFVSGHEQHREQLARLAGHTKYFIVNRAKADVGEGARQQEFGPRFFEGAAAGAILIGDAPEAGPFLRYFDWPDAVFRLPYNSKEIVDVIDSLEKQPERLEMARRRNVVHILRRHDWAHRYQTMLQTLGLEAPPELTARLRELNRRADAIEHARDERVSAPVA